MSAILIIERENNMREIKFRGLAKSGLGWLYGSLVFSPNNFPFIVGGVVESNEEYIAFEFWQPVRPETVGQYTGLMDKNRKKIYEGDIVSVHDDEMQGKIISKVSWHEKLGAWWLDGQYKFREYLYEFNDSISLEIIGNIYENLELLK